jgi:hypothetical protein
MHIRGQPAGLGTLQGYAVDDGAGGRTIAINSVSAGTKNSDILARDFARTCQGKLLISSTDTPVPDLNYDLAAGNQANALGFLPQLANAVKQEISRAEVVPVVTTVIYFYAESLALGIEPSRFQE